MLRFIVCVILIASVACKTVTNNNDNKYIIVLKDGTMQGEIESVKREIERCEEKGREEMQMISISFLLPIVFAVLSKETVEKVSALPSVAYIEVDQPVHMYPVIDTNYTASNRLPHLPELTDLQGTTDRYNLDIMNKGEHMCRDNTYNPPNNGLGADIYILDTGINYSHDDFTGRAEFGGFDVFGGDGSDCHGHGTHCAGIAGGIQSGVAKSANLYSIRVLGCTGSGSTSGIIQALEFVASKHEENKNKANFVASIVSMSLGGGKSTSENNVVNEIVSKGVIVVTASGNEGSDACNSSPGSAEGTINVGAHSQPVQTGSSCSEPIEDFSNWGICVDVIAPGTSISSAVHNNNVDFTTMTGTSMACPHVAGAVALIKKSSPSSTPEAVKQMIIDNSVNDIDRSQQSVPIRNQSASKRLYVAP